MLWKRQKHQSFNIGFNVNFVRQGKAVQFCAAIYSEFSSMHFISVSTLHSKTDWIIPIYGNVF
jgi:hypothetical protein